MSDTPVSNGAVTEAMDRLYADLTGTPLDAVECCRDQIERDIEPNELYVWKAGAIYQAQILITL